MNHKYYFKHTYMLISYYMVIYLKFIYLEFGLVMPQYSY